MAIQWVEKQSLEQALKNDTIDLWETVEKKFLTIRKQKQR
jgi:hypothetical protein